MARIRANFLQGLLTEDLTSSGQLLKGSNISKIPTITFGNHIVLILDPAARYGDPEIVYAIGHTFGSNEAVISRAKEGTTARSYGANIEWAHGPVASDFGSSQGDASQDIETLHWMEVEL